MIEQLQNFIPSNAFKDLKDLLYQYNFKLKVVKERKRKRGDFRVLPNGGYQITINNNLSKEQFLITLVHEIAHLKTFIQYKNTVLPHGIEWKQNFQHLMLPFLNNTVFPDTILPLLAKHLINPKATTDSDPNLSLALNNKEKPSDKKFIFELKHGDVFQIDQATYQLKHKRRTRYLCLHLKSKKEYLIHQNAQVTPIETC